MREVVWRGITTHSPKFVWLGSGRQVFTAITDNGIDGLSFFSPPHSFNFV